MKNKQRESSGFRFLVQSGAIVCSLLLGGLGALYADNPKSGTPAKGTKPAATTKLTAPKAARLVYKLQKGDSLRYRVVGLFHGKFPPFSQPDSPPINLKAELIYVANIKKVDEKGAEVAFTVEEAVLSLLEKEPGPDGKVPPEMETTFPLPVEQVQKALNVTATVRPDGSLTNVSGGDTAPVRIDLGFELRKLFLLTLPVIFPEKPLAVNDVWNFNDGVLGNRPGRVSYQSKLLSMAPDKNNLALRVQQNSEVKVEDRKDKEGKPTDKPEACVDTTLGTVTVTGALTFVAAGEKGAGTERFAGRLKEGQWTLKALLDRKRTIPDPEHPEDPLESRIDVQARLTVRWEPPAKPVKSAQAPVQWRTCFFPAHVF